VTRYSVGYSASVSWVLVCSGAFAGVGWICRRFPAFHPTTQVNERNDLIATVNDLNNRQPPPAATFLDACI